MSANNEGSPPPYSPGNNAPNQSIILMNQDSVLTNYSVRERTTSTANLVRSDTLDWKKPYFGCFDNGALCCITMFLPCVTFCSTLCVLLPEFANFWADLE